MIYSQLMAKIFSEPDSSFTDIIANKIDEAKSNGTASYSDAYFDLAFAEVDGDVVIEDKKNNEVTTATTDDNGETKLECDQKTSSATQPDVVSPRTEGEDGKGVEAPGSTEPDVDSPITIGITDADKAGQGKHFSVSFNGFESEDEANDFINGICTFSDVELANIVDSMNETENLAAKVAAYSDVDDAVELASQADFLRCYANMAEYAGHDVDVIQDRCEYYSDLANEVISDAEMNMSITEYFSDMDEDEINEFFSNLDEDVAVVLYSAIELEKETGESITFSDVNDYLSSSNELDQDINTLFSDMSEDEATEFFSNLTNSESIVIGNALESGESITFSELNDELSLLNLPVTEVFSDYTEDDFNDYLSMFSDGELNIIDQIFSLAQEDDTITYSDYLEILDAYQTQQLMFSDEEVAQLADNATELNKGVDSLESDPRNKELAQKVKVLADETMEDAERAEEAGHDVDAVKEMSECAAKVASEILDGTHKVKVPADGRVVSNVVKNVDVNDAVEDAKSGSNNEKAFSNPCLSVIKPNTRTESAPKATQQSQVEDRVFSTGVNKSSTSNPCLTSKF